MRAHVHPDYWLPDKSRGEHLLALQGPAPCDACAHAVRCAQRELSCPAFTSYAQRGRWRDEDRQPAALHFRRLFKARDAQPQSRPGPPSGLQPQTLAKIDVLRTLFGTFPTLRAVLAAVGLNFSYWQRICATDAELAAHVRGLVQHLPRRRTTRTSTSESRRLTTPRLPPIGRAPRLRERVLAAGGPFKDYRALADALGCSRASLYVLASRCDAVRAHVNACVLTAGREPQPPRERQPTIAEQRRAALRTRVLALRTPCPAFRSVARAADCRQTELFELMRADAEVGAHVNALLGRVSITTDDRRSATCDAV